MSDIIHNLFLIAVIGQNYELGYHNALIWKNKEDLQYFKQKTMNSYVIMGRKTYESLPNLTNRKYIVLSNSITSMPSDILLFNNIEAVKKFVTELKENVFVIGGAEIYRQFIDCVSTMYLTEMEDKFDQADVFFPRFDKSLWDEEKGEILDCNGIKYNHVKYLRKEKTRE